MLLEAAFALILMSVLCMYIANSYYCCDSMAKGISLYDDICGMCRMYFFLLIALLSLLLWTFRNVLPRILFFIASGLRSEATNSSLCTYFAVRSMLKAIY